MGGTAEAADRGVIVLRQTVSTYAFVRNTIRVLYSDKSTNKSAEPAYLADDVDQRSGCVAVPPSGEYRPS